ncbi:hypothetical protein ACVILI_006938 [Mesorhizobium sp. USDA 4775]
MGDLFLLSERQMARISPFFPLSHGVPRVDDRRVVSGIIYVIRNGVVAWITRRLILSGGFQSPDPDFDDAAQVQCRSAGQDCQAEISSDELAGI